MVTILFAIFSIFAFRFRSRTALELRLVALEHQLAVLRRQRPGRPQLSSLDRVLWVLLYRLCPKVIDAMVLVRPATVVGWHRRGFRVYWRWRSCRPGRPRISPENSLVTGKINREFCRIWPLAAILVSNRRVDSRGYSQIPYAKEQGIFAA